MLNAAIVQNNKVIIKNLMLNNKDKYLGLKPVVILAFEFRDFSLNWGALLKCSVCFVRRRRKI